MIKKESYNLLARSINKKKNRQEKNIIWLSNWFYSYRKIFFHFCNNFFKE